mmetsp:Transcript_168914/g.410547  ORF Transcript_168914/g.410547 Transcript_168914/m.410547 type:complete len:137 (-) Transcript_168914:73-483(-)
MSYKRNVQIGRVGYLNYGQEVGKLCVIIDVVDQNRVLIDGPKNLTGVNRQILPLKRLALTNFVLKIGRNSRQKTLTKAFTEADIATKFANTLVGKKLDKQAKRAALTDFDRFKVMLARKQKAFLVNRKVAALKKQK